MSVICSPGFGLNNVNVCVVCDPGYYSPGGSSACIPAPIGNFVGESGSSVYSPCSSSKFLGAASCNDVSFTCAPYIASNTNFAFTNSSICSVYACPGTTIIASGCGSGNGDESNDQYLSLTDLSGSVIAFNDDFCGSRSQISYSVPSTVECQRYVIREGCYDSSACFGDIAVTGGGNCMPGTYFDGLDCLLAPPGYFAPDSSSGVHYVCNYSAHVGAANCVDSSDASTTGSCSAGRYWNSATVSCDEVPASFYNPIDGSSIYYFCPDASSVAGATFCYSHPPTELPTVMPSASPSAAPTVSPTRKPRAAPTAAPTDFPTIQPTADPSASPTITPSRRPTRLPTATPSVVPTAGPTPNPTNFPTAVPSARPTLSPTSKPTASPSAEPTANPSVMPSANPTASPSALPTAQPTAVPTLTTKPITVYPVITISPSGTPTSTTATVLVSMLKPADYDGSIYCQAFTVSSKGSPVAVAQLYSAGQSVAYAAYSSSATLTLTGLQALTSYNIYCMALNHFGYGSTLSEAIRTKISLTTACCKYVSYLSAPSSVVGVPALYTGSLVGKNLYVISLSAAPSKSVLITTRITSDRFGSVKESGISSFPSTGAQISSGAAGQSLTSKFFLSSSLTGTYYIWLNISGASSTEYDVSGVNPIIVKLLPVGGPQEPPVLQQVRFEDNGAYLGVLFDVATDLAGIYTTSWTCSKVLSFSGDDVTSCTWVNSSYIQVALAKAFVAYPSVQFPGISSPFGLRNGILRAACVTGTTCVNDKTAASQAASVLAPLHPITPIVQLKVSSISTRCEDLLIDSSSSSGASGRQWSSVAWTVTADLDHRNDAIVLQNYLSAVGDLTAPIHVPKNLLNLTTYHIALSLTNFLGASGTASGVVMIQSNDNIPRVQIETYTSVVQPSQSVTAVGAGSLSPCADVHSKLVYQWSVTLNGEPIANAAGSSLDPKSLYLTPYSLSAGLTYQATFSVTRLAASVNAMVSTSYTASKSVEIFVRSGAVKVIVAGGYSRSAPVDQITVLDASPSFDENENPVLYSVLKGTSGIRFAWSCKVVTMDEHYGKDCGLFSSPASGPNVTIPANRLALSSQYEVTVSATTADGRFDSRVVNLSPAPSGSVVVSIISTASTLNPSQKLSLFGSVSCEFAVTASWSASFSGSDLDLPSMALTPIAQTFTADEAASQIHFPLSLAQQSLIGGRTYNFKLASCAVSDLSKCTFGEIAIRVNSPPAGGKTNVNPPSGYAFLDRFSLSSTGWFTTADSYPLQYLFAYALSETSPVLTIKSWNPQTFISTKLPTGLFSSNYEYKVIGSVRDVYLSASESAMLVRVIIDPSASSVAAKCLDVLNTSVSSFKLTGDVSALVQTVNMVAATLSAKDCTGAPTCSALNRSACSAVSNTCGECLPGYVGVKGPSNVPCIASSAAAVGLPGQSCSSHGQCVYGSCVTGICIEPNKTCASLNVECSGHGQCLYVDPAGLPLSTCGVENAYCKATCVCEQSYYGDDCSITGEEFSRRETARIAMCNALMATTLVSDKSSALLDSFVSSLVVVFDPAEVTSVEGVAACADVLTYSTAMASAGYLKRAKFTTPALLVQAASLFATTVTAVGSSANISAVPTFAPTSAPIGASAALVSATTDIVGALASTIVSGEAPVNIISGNVQVSVMSPLLSALLDASLSPPQSSAGGLSPSIQIVGNALARCGFSNGYASMSLMGWSSNPFGGSEPMKSPLLSFAPGNGAGSGPVDTSPSDIPLYYVVMPFTSKLIIGNRTANDNPYKNRTLPECTFFDGSRYVPCHSCNVSTYTEDNVTYACYDISQLCSPARRRLGLSTDDDSSAAISLSTYGSIFAALGAELASVLSINPFAIDLSKAKVALILVSCIVFSIIFGVLYFLSWDKLDHQNAAYLLAAQKVREVKARQKEISRLQRDNEFNVSKSRSSEAFGVDETLTVGKLASFKQPRQSSQGIFRALAWVKSIAHGDFLQHHSDTASNDSWDDDVDDEGDNSEHNFAIGINKTGEIGVPTVHAPPDDDSSLADDWIHGHEQKFIDTANPLDVVMAHHEKFKPQPKMTHLERVAKRNHLSIDKDHVEKLGALEMFFSNAMPARIFQPKTNFFYRVFKAITMFHPYICMLAQPSCVITRTMRFLSVWRGILISLFIDTLFFGIFFPDDTTCPSLASSEELCLSMPGKIGSSSLCVWNDAVLSCTLRPPPQSIQFTIVLALLCILINLPVELLIGYIMDEYASRRPMLEQIGLNSNAWLGIASTSVTSAAEKQDPKEVSLLRNWIAENSESPDVSPESGVEMNKGNLAISSASPRQSAMSNARSGMPAELANSVYYDFTTPLEEVNFIVHQVQQMWVTDIEGAMTNRASSADSEARKIARMKAVADVLRVYPSGEPMPLTTYHRLLFHDGRDMLAHNIARARKQADEIDATMATMRDLNMAESMEVFLMQYFVVEQVGVLQRFSLRAQLFEFTNLAPFKVDAIPWILAWIVTWATFLFFIYWIFAWGVVNSGLTLYDWGINFGIGVAQDCLFVQPTKIFLMFVLSVEAARPQLLSIYRTLNAVAISMLSVHERSRENEFRVVQHLSGACRAARRDSVAELPAAYILRHLDDLDLYRCRESKGWALGAIAFVLIVLPAVLALISEGVLDTVMEVFLPSAFSGFILFNVVLLSISPVVLVLPYIIIIGLLWYQFFVVRPSVQYLKKKKIKRSGNRASRYTAKRQSNRNKSLSFSFWLKWKFHGLVSRISAFIVFISTPIFPKTVFKVGSTVHTNDEVRAAVHWRQMNAPASSQGFYDPSEISPSSRDTFTDVLTNQNRLVRELKVPEQIKSMLPQYNTQLPLLYRDDSFVSSGFARVMGLEQSDVTLPIRTPRVATKSVATEGLQGVRTSIPRSKVAGVNEALLRFRMLLEAKLSSSESGCNTPIAEITRCSPLVPSEVLIEVTNTLWSEFYPSGKGLEEVEKGECEKLVRLWIDERIKCHGMDSSVSLDAFEIWLVDMLDILCRSHGTTHVIPNEVGGSAPALVSA